MPTSTFFHLPPEKRQRIFTAAVEEFSQFCFSDASINRIVKSAAIPRGSFYQYFNGKEDLYLYIMEQIGKEKLDILSKHRTASPNMSFFEAVNVSLPAVLEWVNQHPDYNRIGMLMTKDGSDFIRRITAKMDVSAQMIRLIESDQSRGLIRRDIEPSMVARIYQTMIEDFLEEFYLAGGPEKAMADVEKFLEILAHGIVTRKDEAHGNS